MTHHDASHYAAKHGNDRELPETLREALNESAKDNRLSCAQAHRLAQLNHLSPAAIGRAADLLEIRLTGCQLGLFGHKGKNPPPTNEPSPKLTRLLLTESRDHHLSCLQAWKLAADNGYAKIDIGRACNTLNLKISPCQLGAF
ncbi:MAG TPA: hypothetical protein ENN66_11105 [Proteobacteria bacterium]|mgnify:CR=1 FL=1|nr:hypothetical protein [Pseudomonadota bacterium]